jgi:hypothetical protein
MSELQKIVKENRESFYDFSTKKRTPIYRLYVVELIFAFCLSLLFSGVGIGFFGAVLTVYSILIGFSFNVLFQILTFSGTKPAGGTTSLERANKLERINKLADELYFNVSYFNVISIAIVILTLLCFLPYLPDPRFLSLLSGFAIALEIQRHLNAGLVFDLISFCVRTFYYALIIESLYTLIRTVGRMSFYFSMKMDLQT